MRGRSGWAKSSTGHAPLPIIFTRIACPLQFNKRIQFEPGNLSCHRVEAAGRNANVPSLIAPWTVSSVVTCTDCHDNDTGPNAPVPGTVPAGPHGSHYQQLLVARYDRDTDRTAESAAAYALCYKCHDRTLTCHGARHPRWVNNALCC